MIKRFLLEKDLTPEDLAEMHRWLAIYQFEVQRVVNVLSYWKEKK